MKLIIKLLKIFRLLIIFSKKINLRKNGCITTKAGLTNSLKDLIWFVNVDVNTFFPKSFDLKNDDDNIEFVNEFRFSKA